MRVPPISSTQVTNRPENSALHIKTNLSFGDDDVKDIKSIYAGDYLVCRQGKNKTSFLPNISPHPQSLSKADIKLKLLKAANAENYSGMFAQRDPPKSKKACKTEPTNIRLGNDTPPLLTAYDYDYRPVNHMAEFRKPVSSPEKSQIISCNNSSLYNRNCIKDYPYYGPSVAELHYKSQKERFYENKFFHKRDCVAESESSQAGIISRSMLDYRHPLDMVQGNLKLLMARHISPSVRQDSIWNSVSSGGVARIKSEARESFSWPMSKRGLPSYYKCLQCKAPDRNIGMYRN